MKTAFDVIRSLAEQHGFDADWIEGLENLEEAARAAHAAMKSIPNEDVPPGFDDAQGNLGVALAQVRATYDAGTDPVPRLERATERMEAVAQRRPCPFALSGLSCSLSAEHVGPHWVPVRLDWAPDSLPGEPSPGESAIYERGGFVPRLTPHLPAIEAAVAKAASDDSVPPAIATEQREAWSPKPTPAAMLGEAVTLLERVEALGLAARERMPEALQCVAAFRERCTWLRNWLGSMRLEAEARAMGSDGATCATCNHEFPTTSARDAHQATAHTQGGR